MEKLLSHKEKCFAEHYLSTFNATDAATKAGYSDRTARQIGYENLTKPYIQNYIREKSEDKLARLGITQEKVLAELAAIAFSKVTDFLNDDWTLKPINEIPKSKLGAINFQKKKKGLMVKTYDKVKALKILWELVKDESKLK
jgi:phage terminase small subunit